MLTAILLLAAPYAVSAQVVVQKSGDEIVIRNANGLQQRLVRGARAAGSVGILANESWAVLDATGNTYSLNGFAAPVDGAMTMSTSPPPPPRRDSEDDETVIVVGGYQSESRRDSEDDETVIVVGGYQDVLRHLEAEFDAVIRHDDLLDADLISLPHADDPIQRFFEIIMADSLHGRPLVAFFRVLEVASAGATDAAYAPVVPVGNRFGFPNDPYAGNQWNLRSTNLDKALWYPFTPQLGRPVRIGVIDSGINEDNRTMSGLDGVQRIHHVPVAPSAGLALRHGLAVTTLLADASNDGDGIVGLVGTWQTSSCLGYATAFNRQPVEIYSYGVGDFGPVTLYVARAIRQSVADGMDVINLSLRTPPSPAVQAAIEEALAANVVIVAAAGNYLDGTGYRPVSFPANVQGVLAVTATDERLRLSSTAANVGFDLMAPGERIIVGGPDGTWYAASGTSFAAPHVAATAALLRAAVPELPGAAIAELLRTSARYRRDHQGGLLDALAALRTALREAGRSTAGFSPGRCIREDIAGSSQLQASILTSDETPERVILEGNYPNPFNPSTVIRFALPDRQHVRLSVFNTLGQEVRVLVDRVLEDGLHEAVFTPTDLPSGLYFSRLETSAGILTHRMILAR